MTIKLLFVHALSPLHAGTGQSSGAVELAIARDRATGFPILPGSSLKGALRARARQKAGEKRNELEKLYAVFGPETAHASEHAGAVILGDANLLLLPVRSVAGTFGWATSPFLLARFARDCKEAGAAFRPGPTLLDVPITEVRLATDSLLCVGDRVFFEDLDFQHAQTDEVDKAAKALGKLLFPGDDLWAELLRKRLCVVNDDAMAFLSQHATYIVARTALKADSKTVENLWHEECLPVETVLVSLMAEQSNGKARSGEVAEAITGLCSTPLQLGGSATIGRGRCRLVLSGGNQ